MVQNYFLGLTQVRDGTRPFTEGEKTGEDTSITQKLSTIGEASLKKTR